MPGTDIRDLSGTIIAMHFLRDRSIESIHDFSDYLNGASERLADMRSGVRAKEKRIRDIGDIIDAVRTIRDLGPVLDKYNSIFFNSAKEKYLREHGEEIDWVKKAQRLLYKLKVQLPIDAKALRPESRKLGAEVESLLPQLESMKAEMSDLYKIRSHIRKVIPEAMEARNPDGRRMFEDADEERANRRELDELLQRSSDAVLSSAPSDGEPAPQAEPIREPAKKRVAPSHDETR